eukprot:5563763-Pyramimonas_sp.AAC.1
MVRSNLIDLRGPRVPTQRDKSVAMGSWGGQIFSTTYDKVEAATGGRRLSQKNCEAEGGTRGAVMRRVWDA